MIHAQYVVIWFAVTRLGKYRVLDLIDPLHAPTNEIEKTKISNRVRVDRPFRLNNQRLGFVGVGECNAFKPTTYCDVGSCL